MKIDRITTYLVDAGFWKSWLFVRIDTDQGLHGWGEAFTEGARERGIAAEVEDFGRRLVGRDPTQIRRLTGELAVDGASRRRSLEFCSALSGLEIALWDIAGKAAGLPVHRLLGGPCRDRVPVYANCHDDRGTTPGDWADVCVAAVARGFRAVKVYPVTARIQTRRDEEEAVAIVAAVREAIGPDVDLMVDLSRALTPASAISLVDRIAEYRPFWIEEPVPSDNPSALAEVRARSPFPVVTGESLFGKVEFRDVFARRAVDCINPDVCNCGGILELTEIAAWAGTNLVDVSLHNWNSQAIGLAASLQAAACLPDLLTVECVSPWLDRSNELLVEPFRIEDGSVAVPTGAGLGVDLDVRALERYPMREYTSGWID